MCTEQQEKIIEKQIKLLSKWNEENIKKKPEQVRRNCETIKFLLGFYSL